MLTNILYKFFGWKDQLTIECLMPEFEPFCFCIAKKSAFRGIQEASYDIKNFAQKHKDYKNLSSDFVVAYDSPEVARLIDKFAKTIAAYKEYFVSLHVTDQPTIFQTHPHALKMELALPGDVEANAEAINALLNLFVNVVDDAANFRLSNAENSKNLEIRLAYKKREQAKEGSADSKDGGSSVEKELTPEQLKKQEERKMRRRMNRVMKVKVK